MTTNVTRLSHPGIHGVKGDWASLVLHAHQLNCVPGRGCDSGLGDGGAGLGEGGGGKKQHSRDQKTMQVRTSAPAAEVALYHYRVVPLILLLGLLVFLCAPYAPAPRWGIIWVEVYLICHVGVFIGCHRWASHKAFVATTLLKWLLSALAAWCLQGTPAHWAFLHRLHHRFCDQGELDLQAPRPPHELVYGHYAWFNTPVSRRVGFEPRPSRVSWLLAASARLFCSPLLPAAPHLSQVPHFYMSSRVNGEAIISDLLHDESMPSFGVDIQASLCCHLAICAAIALGYGCCELRRGCRAAARQGVEAKSAEVEGGGGVEGGLTSHVCRTCRETAVKTFVIACWYFWLPCAIAFQCVLLVIDAVHLWGECWDC